MEFPLFPELEDTNISDCADRKVTEFSANRAFRSIEREKIEDKYIKLTTITERFNRQSVSYQLSKNDVLHRWLKYKEGFSANLVMEIMKEFGIKEKNLLMDPFMGSGTTALCATFAGINSIGYDILPLSSISINAKKAIFRYDTKEITTFIQLLSSTEVPKEYKKTTPFIKTTQDAYPLVTAKEIAFFSDFTATLNISDELKSLFRLCILNSLERVSYSAKDGQYLRWDYRCPKVIAASKERAKKGEKPFAVRLDKGNLPPLKKVLIEELGKMLSDISMIQKSERPTYEAKCDFKEGSALFELPTLPNNFIDGVITSPPYCNRYDYTRTYSLELAYLGVDEKVIKRLRQDLISCTVESKPKTEVLREKYDSLGREKDYLKIMDVVNNTPAMREINDALSFRHANGEVNNKGVLRMVENYFTELAFIFFELYRICKSGSHVAFVNDNVRYAGEVIPVDFLSCEIAEKFGFIVEKIYTLKQQKGNSSQQMKKYGRVPLRKSITIWRKP